MSKCAWIVSLTPEEAAAKVIDSEFANFLHMDLIQIDEQRKIITLVFEKYFMRVEGRAGVTLIIENMKGQTEVRVITSGVGRGMIFGFDWGASNSLIGDVRNYLSQYILEEKELE